MDDIMRMAESVESAQFANDVIEKVVGKKSLKLNLDKSSFLVVGNRKAKKRLQSKLNESPLMLNKMPMKEEKVIKYLGDSLTSSLEESVHQTVTKRAAIARHAIHEIRNVIEDTRAERMGALNIAFVLWEQGLMSMILHNSEDWVSMMMKPQIRT